MQNHKVAHLFSLIQASPIEGINAAGINFDDHCYDFKQKGIQLDVKRDDRLHPIISGNKWRKIKHLLLAIERQGYSKISAMGGAYSNFLHVLAYVCHLLGWQCELYVRAFAEQPLTQTLKDCINWGAKIHYVDRKTFREIRQIPPILNDDIFWISEGGADQLAVKGIKEVFMEVAEPYDYVVIASATGVSLAGLAIGATRYQPNAKIIGISVLNNADQQRENISTFIDSSNFVSTSCHSVDWEVIDGYEFGGFAKSNERLDKFVNQFSKGYFPIEKIYSGKSFFAVFDLIENGYFNENSKILLLHCGGMQGVFG